MDVRYQLASLQFEWDSNKAAENRRKHGVDFVEAAEVFLDPLALYGVSDNEEETRFFVLGETLRTKVVLVVHTDRGARTRIISARPATRSERRLYERGQFDR
ncbi:MAG: BrnT family toxin [Dehalococcoidia bacterium]